eukprot:822598-Rhodomonas_salina.3
MLNAQKLRVSHPRPSSTRHERRRLLRGGLESSDEGHGAVDADLVRELCSKRRVCCASCSQARASSARQCRAYVRCGGGLCVLLSQAL